MMTDCTQGIRKLVLRSPRAARVRQEGRACAADGAKVTLAGGYSMGFGLQEAKLKSQFCHF